LKGDFSRILTVAGPWAGAVLVVVVLGVLELELVLALDPELEPDPELVRLSQYSHPAENNISNKRFSLIKLVFFLAMSPPG
jgi:hypothetical protein